MRLWGDKKEQRKRQTRGEEREEGEMMGTRGRVRREEREGAREEGERKGKEGKLRERVQEKGKQASLN